MAENRITFADLYPKNEKENLTPNEIESLRQQIEGCQARHHLSSAERRHRRVQTIRRGERAPVCAWEVTPDGPGGFIRRQLDPRTLAPARAAARK